MNNFEHIDFKALFENNADVVSQLNDEYNQQTIDDYKEFEHYLREGKCSFCQQPLSYIDKNNPCLHWLIHPNINKKQLEKVLLSERFGYFRVTSYLRWIANTERYVLHINNLKPENLNKITELTIKYKNYEWAFNVSKTDYEGHHTTQHSDFPHYHIQIKRDGYTIVKFNNYHIPFNQEDLILFAAINQEAIEMDYYGGEGLSMFTDPEILQPMLNGLKIAKNEHSADVRTRTIFCPRNEEEKKLVQQLIEEAKIESKMTRLPIGEIVKRKLNERNLGELVIQMHHLLGIDKSKRK